MIPSWFPEFVSGSVDTGLFLLALGRSGKEERGRSAREGEIVELHSPWVVNRLVMYV